MQNDMLIAPGVRNSPVAVTKKISVLVVDDHPVVRRGLSEMLRRETDLEVIDEAENGRSAVAIAKKAKPDVILMDISMPVLNGLEATRQIRKTVPHSKVVGLSTFGDDEFVEQMMEAGAKGYLTKDTASTELAWCIRTVHSGKTAFSSAVSHRMGRARALGRSPACAPKLSPRQVEVLQLIAEGFATKQIAGELGISIKTVEKHREQLMQKLNVHGVASLTRYAISSGVVTCQSLNRLPR